LLVMCGGHVLCGWSVCELCCGVVFCCRVIGMLCVSCGNLLVCGLAVLRVLLAMDIFSCGIQFAVVHQLLVQHVRKWRGAVWRYSGELLVGIVLQRHVAVLLACASGVLQPVVRSWAVLCVLGRLLLYRVSVWLLWLWQRQVRSGGIIELRDLSSRHLRLR
jgi:hypothetical protein